MIYWYWLPFQASEEWDNDGYHAVRVDCLYSDFSIGGVEHPNALNGCIHQ